MPVVFPETLKSPLPMQVNQAVCLQSLLESGFFYVGAYTQIIPEFGQIS